MSVSSPIFYYGLLGKYCPQIAQHVYLLCNYERETLYKLRKGKYDFFKVSSEKIWIDCTDVLEYCEDIAMQF